MNKLTEALRRRFKNQKSALRALGLDISILSDQPIKQKDTPMAKSLVGFQDPKPRRQMARDAQPTRQFLQEQYAGEDDQETEHESSNPEVAALADFLRQEGLDADLIERACAVAMEGKYSAMDADPLAKLRDYLKRQGQLTDAEIEEAIEHAKADRGMGKDLPPDLPSGGRPTPEGKLTPNRPNGMGNGDARSAAMDAAMRIATDVPIRAMDSATRDARMLNHVRGKMDAHTHAAYMAQTAKGFAARWPDAAKIKQA